MLTQEQKGKLRFKRSLYLLSNDLISVLKNDVLPSSLNFNNRIEARARGFAPRDHVDIPKQRLIRPALQRLLERPRVNRCSEPHTRLAALLERERIAQAFDLVQHDHLRAPIADRFDDDLLLKLWARHLQTHRVPNDCVRDVAEAADLVARVHHHEARPQRF